jgi:hypothetical protein
VELPGGTRYMFLSDEATAVERCERRGDVG